MNARPSADSSLGSSAASVADLKTVITYDATLARLGDDRGLLQQMIEFFLEDAPPLMEKLDRALAEQVSDQVERTAHSMKGLAANLGALAVASHAARIEQCGREKQLPPAVHELSLLKVELERLLRVLRRSQG